MFKFKASLLVIILTAVVTFGCKKERAPEDNEEELITTVQLIFKETGGSTEKTFSFRDPDGPGGIAPVQFDDIVLAPNKTYQCRIELLNESVSPFDVITEEVEAEAEDHQFYFLPAAGLNLVINNLNQDANGLALGTNSTWATGPAGNGKVRVILKHKPGFKAAADTYLVGDTDIDLEFSVLNQ